MVPGGNFRRRPLVAIWQIFFKKKSIIKIPKKNIPKFFFTKNIPKIKKLVCLNSYVCEHC
jgi:hypothetical protein